jgi:hypothetical protein
VSPSLVGGLVLAAGAVLAGLEVAAFVFGGVMAGFAAVIWAVLGVVCLALSVWVVLREVVVQVRDRQLWILVLGLFAAGYCGWGLPGHEITSLNHEATQQVGDALDKVDAPDAGYVALSFLGYPNRQYMVAAVPSLVAGRSVTALRLGYAAPFVLGVLLFTSGLARFLADRGADARFWAAIAGIALFSFPYVRISVRDYEQVIIPITYTLFVTGWLLLMVVDRKLSTILPLGWFGAMLGAAYTPALSPWALLLVVLAWLTVSWRREPGTPLVLAGAWLWVTTVGVAFLVVRDDVATRPDRALDLQVVWAKTAEGGEILLSMGSGQGYSGVLMALPLLVYLVTALVFANGWRHAVVGWWFLATAAVSVILAGYAEPPPHLSIKRAITALPPVLAAMAHGVGGLSLGEGVAGTTRRLVAAVIAMAVATGGLVAWEEHTPVRAFDYLFADLAAVLHDAGIEPTAPLTLAVYSSEGDFGNLPDFCRYLYPEAKVLRNQPPQPGDLVGRHLVVYVDLAQVPRVSQQWPELSTAPFAYTLPAGGRQMMRGTRFMAPVEP